MRHRRISLVSALLFPLLIALLRLVDVAPIGPEGTRVGLSHLNGAVRQLLGVHLLWYRITEWLGAAAIVTALTFALLGLVQLLRRRSLKRVDRPLLALGGLYCAVGLLYALFEVCIVNYRPVLLPGAAGPEASFPSSHTMLVCVVLGSAAMILPAYVRHRRAAAALRGLCAVLIVLTVAGRLLSGVHWFTDILGGALLSAALLGLFAQLSQ